MNLPKQIYAVVSLEEGDGIIAINGTPLCCLGNSKNGEALLKAIAGAGRGLAETTHKRIVLLKFSNVEIVEELSLPAKAKH